MAVDNPPLPAQPVVNPRLATLKDVVLIVSGLGGFIAVLIAAIALFASLTITPVREELRLMRTEMKSGFEAAGEDRRLIRQEMKSGFEAVDAEFKAVRAEMQRGFEAAAEDRRLIRQEMQRGFEAAGEDRRLIRQEMKSGFEAVDVRFKAVDAEFKAIRKDLADLSERLTRLETLLEQGAGQGQGPETPDTE